MHPKYLACRLSVPIVQHVMSVAMAAMGRAAEEVLATLTGFVVLVVFGGVFVGVNTPRVAAVLELSSTTTQVLMISAGVVLLATVIVTIITLVTSISRRAR